MPYRRRFFGEDPWFTSSYQQPGYIGADAPMWGDIAAPALEETPEGMALRSLYYANALLPYLNPYSRAVLTNRIFAWEQALKDFPQTGATKGATLGGVIPGYVSSVPRAVSSQGFYRHAGTTAEALEAAMRAGWYLHDFARQGIMLSLTDATIGAVAVTYDLVLITKNRKHYLMREVRLWDWGVG